MHLTAKTEFPHSKILLSTLNSSYVHSAFGLRYLYANLQELKHDARILEFTIAANARQIAENILSHRPQIVGFGVYIWNAEETLRVVSILKKVAPEVIVILGGPEVSHEPHSQKIVQIADYTIQGEAEVLFYDLCVAIFAGDLPANKLISGALPDVKKIKSPYFEYTDDDIANRVIYVEASRGCPFKCEYCLSSLDKSVRSFDLEVFLAEMDELVRRGVRQFKFVDRTFNLSIDFSSKILQFFLERLHHNIFIHFEMIPDRLPIELRKLIQLFPAGSLQFEIGIQTFDPAVAKNVSRRNDFAKVSENFRFLREETGVHTHADLIVGLPGETLPTFARGFDELVKYAPDEIQVGVLKRLKGTPIVRHEKTFSMLYSDFQPFEILSTSTMSYQEIQQMQKFAKFWDLYGNSGNFVRFVETMKAAGPSLFESFFAFSQAIAQKVGQLHSISQERLVFLAHEYMTGTMGRSEGESAEILIEDFCFGSKRRDLPNCLKAFKSLYDQMKESKRSAIPATSKNEQHLPERQLRHLRANEAVQLTPTNLSALT